MMTTTSTTTQPPARPTLSRLLWAGPLAIIAATVVIVVLQQFAVVVLRPDPAFLPLTLIPPIVFTVIGMLGAVIVYALVGRFARNPAPLFRRIALIALSLSFIPDILMLITGFNPGTTFANVVVLILMHVVAWVIAVELLPRLTSA